MELGSMFVNYNAPLDLRVNPRCSTPMYSNFQMYPTFPNNYYLHESQYYRPPLEIPIDLRRIPQRRTGFLIDELLGDVKNQRRTGFCIDELLGDLKNQRRTGFCIDELLGDVKKKESTENVQHANNSLNSYLLMLQTYQQIQMNQLYLSNFAMPLYTDYPAVQPITIQKHGEEKQHVEPAKEKSPEIEPIVKKKAPVSRKVKMAPLSRKKANERERKRVDCLTKAFKRLKGRLHCDKENKTSKLHVLRFACEYIKSLQDTLSDFDKENQSTSAIKDQ